MQHSRNAVDLHHCANDLPGELALPLLVRGKLNGIVLMGFKQNGQHYRPDEVSLLANGAHQIGLDLESLRVSELEHRLRASDIAAEEARRSASMTEQKLIATEKQAELLEQKSCAQEREAIALRCLLKAETQ
jgi:GAF domain-containing protein